LTQVFLADTQGWLATFDLQEDLRPDARVTVQALQAAATRSKELGDEFGKA
jgi:Cu2+-exporting ATPase